MGVDFLFFGAHPDDVEWAAGGICLLLKGKASFAIIDMMNGEMGSRGTPEERKNEAKLAAEFMGAEARGSLNLPDCALMDTPENRMKAAAAVRRFRPRVVVAPYWEDRHPDHAACGQIVRNSRVACALKNSPDPNAPMKPDLYLYYPLNRFREPSVVVDTTSVFQQKLELVGIHKSQFSKTAAEFGVVAHGLGDYLFGLESRDRFSGSLIGTHYGEALIADQPLRVTGIDALLRARQG